MSLDTKYRPRSFDDVLGQEAIIAILRRFIVTGRALHQSYLFAGPFGSGKTTLGRITARVLMCSSPTPTGDPCDTCDSCKSILETGASYDFVEVDAATNSGKADVQKIVEDIQYSTFSGRRRIYLFDEAHQLSKDALDALLKPLEETIVGTQEKRLICIFCTTEPEKMKATIFSRCAPTFVIQPVPPPIIAKRLAYVCEQEGYEYDLEMLQIIAEITECHIRDALKAIEGVSMLGPINRENVSKYLRLDMNLMFVDVLEQIGKNLPAAISSVKQALEKSSPATCYEKLAYMAMLAYQVGIGALKSPSYIDAGRLEALARAQNQNLIGYASKFSSRPGRPTESMLLCDLGTLHYGGASIGESSVVLVHNSVPAQSPPATHTAPHAVVVQPTVTPPTHSVGTMQKPSTSRAEVVTDFRAVGKPEDVVKVVDDSSLRQMEAQLFSAMVAMQVANYVGRGNGATGRTDLDRR